MRLLALVIALLLLAQLAAGVQRSEYIIEDGGVLVTHTFANATFLNISIPKDAYAISVSAQGINIPSEVSALGLRKRLSVPGIYSSLKVSYVSRELVQRPGNTFFVEEVQVLDKMLEIKVTLPQQATLIEPLSGGFGSVYPKPLRADTDGRQISFFWDLQVSDTTFPILIEYKSKTDNSLIILSALLVVAGGGALALFLLKKKRAEKPMESPQALQNEKKEKKPLNIEFRLKEDEKAVINVLKLKNGSTSQSTIRIATGFSKTSLSRILMELEARNVILKEKKGNRNLIILKNSIWNDLEQE